MARTKKVSSHVRGATWGFANAGDVPVRWLETQAPQPPSRHSYRFTRDWDYLRTVLDG